MKYLTKKQLIRKSQRDARQYLNSVLEPVLFDEIAFTALEGEMPYKWREEGSDKLLRSAIKSALESQLKYYKKKP